MAADGDGYVSDLCSDWHQAGGDHASLAHIAAFSRDAEDSSPAALWPRRARTWRRPIGAQVTVVPNPHVVELSSTQVRVSRWPRAAGRTCCRTPVYGYIQRRSGCTAPIRT